MTLRHDERQWLVYDEPSVVAAVRALEALSLWLMGQALQRRPEVEYRAMGNVAESLGKSRLRYMLGLLEPSQPTDEERVAGQHLAQIIAHLLEDNEKPLDASDELWAAMVYFDSYLRASGLGGDRWQQQLARGVR